jgi:hypothetical protein
MYPGIPPPNSNNYHRYNTGEEDAYRHVQDSSEPHHHSMDIARGVVAWRDDRRENIELGACKKWKTPVFFTARVGLRFVAEHHVLSSPRESTRHCRNVAHVSSDQR